MDRSSGDVAWRPDAIRERSIGFAHAAEAYLGSDHIASLKLLNRPRNVRTQIFPGARRDRQVGSLGAGITLGGARGG